ncbi:hypothetical protein C1T31_08300 [Hanstruepera neustonica]|uniref:Uncharacterized protein n=1 Tax=Hanstruepera neustonica TaxID=1445657 RepID=A0A2K1DYR1_9FLAO|nr:hypothetical protein C1T31_08300 [Hanstruepera neustonica]
MFYLGTLASFPQGYAKDSLQIKVYTEIDYENREAKDITLKKVFCDYCSDAQISKIGYAALLRAHDERYLPENILVNGTKKLAIIIRISKEDFAAITDDAVNNKEEE